MNRNAIYVEEQPKHSIASIVVVNDPLISETVHKNLDMLTKTTDLIFIFNENYKGDIIIPKLVRLYTGCSYICGDKGTTLSQTLMDVFDYCNEVFNKHHAFLITDTTKLDVTKVDDDFLDLVNRVTLSEITKPIFEKTRLTTDELREIYISPKKSWFRGNEDINIRSFSTHRSTSPIMYIRKDTIEKFMTLFRDKRDIVANLFIESDVSYFLTSMLVRSGFDIISQNINEVKYNGENLQTERKK